MISGSREFISEWFLRNRDVVWRAHAEKICGPALDSNTVNCIDAGVSTSYSIIELAGAVNAWCRQHRVEPANGQTADALSERSLRFYRTIGLLDAPDSGEGRGYGEKHFLQLVAIRLLQAQGLPLRKIRELLQARPMTDLREIQRRGLAALDTVPRAPVWQMAAGESWSVWPLDDDLMLVSRRGLALSADTLNAVRHLLSGKTKKPQTTKR